MLIQQHRSLKCKERYYMESNHLGMKISNNSLKGQKIHLSKLDNTVSQQLTLDLKGKSQVRQVLGNMLYCMESRRQSQEQGNHHCCYKYNKENWNIHEYTLDTRLAHSFHIREQYLTLKILMISNSLMNHNLHFYRRNFPHPNRQFLHQSNHNNNSHSK